MPDDIRDLLGRYATGSLTGEEQKRLFDAALDDQDVFDELAQEREIKELLAQPGARDRLIGALRPPPRNKGWIFGVAATVALTAVLVLFLVRPVPKPVPQQTAAAGKPNASEAAPELKPLSEPQAAQVPAPPKAQSRAAAAEKNIQPAEDNAKSEPAKQNALDRKDADQVAAAPPAPVAPAPAPGMAKKAEAARDQAADAVQVQAAQQNAPGGPRQDAIQNSAQNKVQTARAALGQASGVVAARQSFGFHYSLETKRHLIVIPGADGYLSVKSDEGTALFASKGVAAGILLDIALPDAANSVTITFAQTPAPVLTAPIARTEPQGAVTGTTGLAVTLKIIR